MRWGLDALVCGLAGALVVACALFVRLAIVGGDSMEPALVAGDVCVSLAGGDVTAGDIVLYERPGSGPVLHRVIDVGRRGEIRTRGDANHVADRQPVPESQVRGRVIVVVPFGRAARGWIRAVRGATLLTQS